MKIWDSAFQDSTLAKIEYNNAGRLTEIASGAFWGTNLTQAVIPDSVTALGTDVFRLCEELTSCKIYASLSEIPASAFLKCDKLAEVYLPASLVEIGASAFGGYNGFPSDGYVHGKFCGNAGTMECREYQRHQQRSTYRQRRTHR